MKQEAGVRQAKATLLGNADINQRAGGCDPAGADRPDLRLHELDHVVNAVAGFNVAARRTDEETDVLIAGRRKRHELRAHFLRQFLGDRAVDENRTRLEKVRLRFLAERQFGLLVVLVVVVVHPCFSGVS
ncbi:hypothetical protein D9M70_515780 [compost metagenome]